MPGMEKINKKIFKTIFFVAVFASALSLFFVINNQKPAGKIESSEADFDNNLKIIFFDVGQGDSALIITPKQKTIFIDGGPDNTVLYKLGEYLPYWQRKIDLMVLSHPHADHLVGFNEVLRRYDVKKILMTGVLHATYEYEEWLNQLKDRQIPIEIAVGPSGIDFEPDTRLQILYPTESLAETKMENLNNSSIVLKVTYGQNSLLFTGDLESDVQSTILDQDLSALILKFPHHGSTNGYSEKFINAVNPKYAVISAGENNFGHPSKRTINALERAGVKILITKDLGDIIFNCNQTKCVYETTGANANAGN